MFDFQGLHYILPAIIVALTFHEYAHGRVAYAFGDPTAKNAGRLSLNPLKHLDLLGTLLLVFAGFGWAKPVPINRADSPNTDRARFKNTLAKQK